MQISYLVSLSQAAVYAACLICHGSAAMIVVDTRVRETCAVCFEINVSFLNLTLANDPSVATEDDDDININIDIKRKEPESSPNLSSLHISWIGIESELGFAVALKLEPGSYPLLGCMLTNNAKTVMSR
ncbi:hypothetical protein OUZ56_001206 [Daphnia magna]|uniref:Uncharacterized protein n=1 Tax=Daphnia magna TaxID=35525 RepID=A0ABR0A2M7_9CRUS|nr:hypothetical protein OUZ56_001206 [Daphnia magna]